MKNKTIASLERELAELKEDIRDFAVANEIWEDSDYEKLHNVCVRHGIAKNVPYNIKLHGKWMGEEYDLTEGTEIWWYGKER